MVAANKNIFLYIFFTIFLIIFLIISWYAIDVLLLTFAAILLAIFLRALVALLKKVIQIPDGLAVTAVLLSLVALSLITLTLILPIIVKQVQAISNDIPQGWEKIEKNLRVFFELNSVSGLMDNLDLKGMIPYGKNIIAQTARLFSTTFGFIGSFFVFTSIGIFLAYEPEVYKEGIINLAPSGKREKMRDYLDALEYTLRLWIFGKMLSMLFVGILTAVGLWMLKIPMALTLGLLAAILTFIPNIGPIISAIPAVLIALIQSPLSALYVILLCSVIQIIESYIITPIVQKKTILQPPALVIVIQLIMALLTGILGLALATPLLAVLAVTIDKFYLQENYIDPNLINSS